MSSITACEPNERQQRSDTGSDTSEQTMLLTTAPNAPWLLHRHRYLEECSRFTSRATVLVLAATLTLFSIGLLQVEPPRRADAAHTGKLRAVIYGKIIEMGQAHLKVLPPPPTPPPCY